MKAHSQLSFLLGLTFKCCTVAAVLVGRIADSHGQTNAEASGDWSDSATWSAGEPNDTTAATINGGFSVTVTQDGEITNALDVGTVAGQTGNLDVTGGTLNVTDAADPVNPPNHPSIRLGQVAGSAGNLTMSGGFVNIDGAIGSAIGEGDLLVGDNGTGDMTMTGGELFASDEIIIGVNAGSSGTIDVSGGTLRTNGRSIVVGFTGDGELNVSGSGSVFATHDLLVGFVEGSSGEFNLSGGTVEAGILFSNAFGENSTATMTQTGGVFNARFAYVLGQNTGTTTFDHSGGDINVLTGAGDMNVSDGGNNTTTYNVSGTANVSISNLFEVGKGNDTNGTVNQSGGTITAARGVLVGSNGAGAWNMSGGVLNQTATAANPNENSNFLIGRNNAVGVFNHAGGIINASGSMFLGDFDDSDGTYVISGGSLSVAGNLNVGAAVASNAPSDRMGGAGQALRTAGTFVVNGSGGDVNIDGNLLANPADKDPSRNGPGDSNDSMLRFITDASGISMIDVAGIADLDGAMIDIDDAGGFFSANPMGSLRLIDAAGGFGNVFTMTPTEAAGTGEEFMLVAGDELLYDLAIISSGAGQALVATRLPGGGLVGDYNGDGIVNAADYTVWRDSLGQTGMGLAADGDGNEMIDQDDYQIWKDNFGATSEGGGGLAPVPEPSALAMLLAIGTALGLCQLKRNR